MQQLTPTDFAVIIGQKEIELSLLRAQIQELKGRLLKQAAEQQQSQVKQPNVAEQPTGQETV